MRKAYPETLIARSTQVGKVSARVVPPSGTGAVPTEQGRELPSGMSTSLTEQGRELSSGTGTSLTEQGGEPPGVMGTSPTEVPASGTDVSTFVPTSSSIYLPAAGYDAGINDSVPGATVGDVQAAVPNQPTEAARRSEDEPEKAPRKRVSPQIPVSRRSVHTKRASRWREVGNAAYTTRGG